MKWEIFCERVRWNISKFWIFYIIMYSSSIQSYDKSNSQKAACAFKTNQYLMNIYRHYILPKINLFNMGNRVSLFGVCITHKTTCYMPFFSLHLFPPISSFILYVALLLFHWHKVCKINFCVSYKYFLPSCAIILCE